LFPHAWIKDLHGQHSSWFSEYSEDVAGTLQPFALKSEGHKIQLRDALIARAEQASDLSWADRFIEVLSVLDSSLAEGQQSLNGN
jgi:hypothetical protein